MKRYIMTGLILVAVFCADSMAAPPAGFFLGLAGYSNGVCVLPRCTDMALASGLAADGGFVVFTTHHDETTVRGNKTAAGGLLNQSVYVERLPESTLALANNYADMLVVSDLQNGNLTNLPLAEIVRVLTPNRKAIVGGASVSSLALTNWLVAGGVSSYTLTNTAYGWYAVFSKVRSAGEGDWSHWYSTPDNNPINSESVLKYPFLSRFYMTPWRAAQPQLTLAANGRVFRVSGSVRGDNDAEAAQPYFCTVTAHNGYNGRELWKRKWSMAMTTQKSGYIATADRFYMMDTNKVLVLDAATGDELAGMEISGSYPFPKWMALVGDTLYMLLGAADEPAVPVNDGSKYVFEDFDQVESPWDKGRLLVAYNVNNWSNLWSHLEPSIIESRQIAVQGNYLYFNAPSTNWNAMSTGLQARVACLNRNTGALVWQNTNSATLAQINEFSGDFGHKLARPRVGMLAGTNRLFISKRGSKNLVALDAVTGTQVWSNALNGAGNNVHAFLFGGELYEEGLFVNGSGNNAVLDPATGTYKRRFDTTSTGCARYTVTSNAVYCAGGLGFDMVRGMKIEGSSGLKADCNDSTIPANGGLYAAPQICGCNVSARGFVAMEAAPDNFIFSPTAGVERLESTTNLVGSFAAITTNDWPTYRANNRRSAASVTAVSNSSSILWTWRPAATNYPTAAIAAGGFVFFGGGDGAVRCLNAATGKEIWNYATGSRIIAAPSVADGRVYAGSGDGYVYCLSASNGALLWRFRAAPYERWITVYGALANTWPVDSGVLVESGRVYAASGIMDSDGTHVYCLNATNGAMIWQNNDSAFVNTNSHKGIGAQGFLTTAKGKLWMPGGAVCSPASYDLATGVCAPAESGFTRALRGRDIGVFADDLLVFGSYMQYSKPNDWYGVKGESIGFLALSNNGAHAYSEVSIGVVNTTTPRLMPAWRDDRTLACVDSADGLSCWNTTQMTARIKAARTGTTVTEFGARPAVFISETGNPAKLWQTSNIPMFGIAMAADAGLLLRANVPAYGQKPSSFWLSAIGVDTNVTLWSKTLPSEPVIGGLAVDKDGIIIVPLVNGNIISFADPEVVSMIMAVSNAISVAEGKTNSVGLYLSEVPANSVTVNVAWAFGDTNVSVVGTTSFVFTTSSWNTTQMVSIAASEDPDDLNGTATITCSADGYPNRDITVTEVDNDDLTPPSWYNGYPNFDNLGPTGFRLDMRISETGSVYYVVVDHGAAAPASTNVKAAKDAFGVAVPTNRSGTFASAQAEKQGFITGLSRGTMYDVYCVAQDIYTNLQTSPTMLVFTSSVAVGSYFFTGSDPAGDLKTPHGEGSAQTGLLFSAFALKGPVLTTSSILADTFIPTKWPNSANADTNTYVSFTINATPGYALTLTNITFDWRSPNAESPSNLLTEIRREGVVMGTSQWTRTGLGWTYNRPFNFTAFDISGSQTAEFRLYGWNAGVDPAVTNTARLYLDNVNIFGTVGPSEPLPITTNALTVQSVHGSPDPSVGSHIYTNGSFTCLAGSPDNAQYPTQYVCTGWTLEGNTPASGGTASFSLTLTNNATLTWLWITNMAPPVTTNSLTVGSAHGSPSPSGVTLYTNGSVLGCSVSGSPIINGTTQLVCTGWTLVGNSPVSGSSTNFSLTLTNTATLTWLWTTNVSGGGGVTNRLLFDFGVGTNMTPGYWNNVTNNTVAVQITNAVNSTGALSGVSLRITDQFNTTYSMVNGGVVASNLYPASAQADYFAVAPNEIGAVRLEGLATNQAYTLTFFGSRALAGTRVARYSVGANAVTLDCLNNSNTVAVLTNLMPDASGQIEFVVSNTVSAGYGYLGVLDVTWEVPEAAPPVYYLLTVNGMQGGAVNTTGGVYSAGSNVPISATANQSYHFVSWTGNVTSANATTNVLMDANKTVWALFAENMYTNNVPATWLVQHGLPESDAGAVSDSDGDGLLAWQEYIAGTVPTNGNSVFAISNGWTGAQSAIIRWPGVTGRTYKVMWSSNLVNGFTTNLSGDISGPQNSFTDTIHGTEISGFYKMDVRLNP